VLSDPRLTILAVTITHQRGPDPFKRLACGVFTQALRDCGFLGSARIDRKLQKEAIAFLTNGGEAFRFWCHALNQHPETVRSELKRRLRQQIPRTQQHTVRKRSRLRFLGKPLDEGESLTVML